MIIFAACTVRLNWSQTSSQTALTIFGPETLISLGELLRTAFNIVPEAKFAVEIDPRLALQPDRFSVCGYAVYS